MAKHFTFDLINAYSKEHALYTEQVVTGNKLAQSLSLEIENISGQTITFNSLKGEASRENSHFSLFFPSRILSTNSAMHGKLANSSDFAMSPVTAGGVVGSYYIYFICHKPELAEGEILTLELEGFMAEDREKDCLMEVAMHFQNISSGITNSKSKITVKNDLLNRPLPLQFSFRGNNSVLNNGHSEGNDLTLMVSNMATPEDSSLQAAGNIAFNEDSRIQIGFDVQLQGGEKKDWALGMDNDIKNCQVSFPAGWKQTQGHATVDGEGKIRWEFAPDLKPGTATEKATWTLGSLQDMLVTVSGIKTNFPAGYTNLYFSYQNVPNYGSGEFRVPILKTAMVARGNQIGIGIDPEDDSSLDGSLNFKAGYGSRINLWKNPASPKSPSILAIGNQDATLYFRTNQNFAFYQGGVHSGTKLEPGSGGSAKLVIADGNVGIGTTKPTHRLEVAGTLKVTDKASFDKGVEVKEDLTVSGKISIGTGNNGSQDQLTVNGRIKSVYGNDGGMWTDEKHTRFVGSAANDIGLFNCGWAVRVSPSQNVSAAKDLSVGGNLSVTGNQSVSRDQSVGGNLSLNGSATFEKSLNVKGATTFEDSVGISKKITLEFGQGTTKEGNAGKIGYQTFSDGLDIVGAGTGGGRKIRLWDRAGINGDNQGYGVLEVYGQGLSNYGPVGVQFLYPGQGGDNYWKNYSEKYSIWASNGIGAEKCLAWSDARIKNVIGQSDPGKDLSTLLQLKVTDYTKVDTIKDRMRPHKKLVAQEVREVFAQAVSLSTGVVPDIYQKATVNGEWIELATDLKPGEQVRIISADNTALMEVLEVAPDRFRVSGAFTEKEVFVYGRQVDDFHAVDYDAIAMLNVSATQELYRQLESLRAAQERMERQLEGFKKNAVKAEA